MKQLFSLLVGVIVLVIIVELSSNVFRNIVPEKQLANVADISGLIAYWKFNEGSGTSSSDSSGLASAMSLINGATWETGKYGQAVTFDGVNDYASAPHTSALDRTNKDVTMCLWLKRNGDITTNSGIAGKSFSSTASYGVYFDTTTKILPLVRNSVDARSYDTYVTIGLGTWTHVCSVYDDNGTTNTIRIYKDGSLGATINNAIRIGDSGEPFVLGKRSSYYSKISVDEVRVYDRALSASEISTIYSSNPETPPPASPPASPSPIQTTTTQTQTQTTQTQTTQTQTAPTQTTQTQTTQTQTSPSQSPTQLYIDNSYQQAQTQTQTQTYTPPPAEPQAQDTSVQQQPIVQTPPPSPSTVFYVSTAGSSSGDGSASRPWNLSTALAHPAAVKPGATIWLRGGTYRGAFHSVLTGTAAAPITIRAYPGERAIIDGNGYGSDNPLWITGSYVTYWGLEVTNSDTNRPEIKGSRPAGLNIRGPNNKFINMIVHDNGQGFGFWREAPDSEIYGSIVYFNGNSRYDHNIYVINNTGSKLVADNIIFNAAGHGLHGYGEAPQALKDITYEGNISFSNGNLRTPTGAQRNFLLGGWGFIAENPTLRNNYGYYPTTSGENLNIGYGGGCSNARLTGNYLVGGSGVVEKCTISEMSNNYFAFASFTGTNFSPSSYSTVNTLALGSPIKTPTTNRIVVRPNKYEAGRAHIAIFNWEMKSSVLVDVSSVLTYGDTYELRNAQDYFNDIITGTYVGVPISIPMTGRTVGKPYGFASPPSTFPQFGAFVLIKKSSGTGTVQVTQSAPTQTTQQTTPPVPANQQSAQQPPQAPQAPQAPAQPAQQPLPQVAQQAAQGAATPSPAQTGMQISQAAQSNAPQPASNAGGGGGGGGGGISISGGSAFPNSTSRPTPSGIVQGSKVAVKPAATPSYPPGSVCSQLARNLVQGSQGEDVRQLQKFLNSQGFTIAPSGAGSPGNETIYFGGLTKSALTKFQLKYASEIIGTTRTADGSFGPYTRAKVLSLLDCVGASERSQEAVRSAGSISTSTPATSTPVIGVFNRTLVRGSTGDDVRQLQKLLNKLGYSVALIGPGSTNNETTYFGVLTEAALKKMQCSTLEICSGNIHGIVDTITRTELNRLSQ